MKDRCGRPHGSPNLRLRSATSGKDKEEQKMNSKKKKEKVDQNCPESFH
jgi:hypothetical protein